MLVHLREVHLPTGHTIQEVRQVQDRQAIVGPIVLQVVRLHQIIATAAQAVHRIAVAVQAPIVAEVPVRREEALIVAEVVEEVAVLHLVVEEAVEAAAVAVDNTICFAKLK
jgi:hypothetical protein